MKTIKSVITLAFVLLLCLTAQAQWAGEDKEVLRELDNSQTVTIGVAGSSDMCYEWDGPHIVSTNPNQAVIVVHPTDPEESYICTRVSSCGVEQDLVKVKVIDTISIVSVTPLKNCYNHGDLISTSDFEIVTYPAGHQSMVEVNPNMAYNAFEVFGTDETQELTFSLSYNGHVSTNTATVNVYNDNLTTTSRYSVNLGKFVKQIGSIQEKVKTAKKVLDVLNKFAKPGVAPCAPQLIVDEDAPQTNSFHTCCNGETVEGFNYDYPVFNANIGISCDFPTQFRVPGVGGLYLHVAGRVGASVGPLRFKYKGDCDQVSVPFAIYVLIEGGAAVIIRDPSLFRADLKLVAKAQTSWAWVIGQSITWKPLTVDVNLTGIAVFRSKYKKKIVYPLFSHTFFN